MRVSANWNDPGYANLVAVGGLVRVFLDGIERDGVLTADEEKRFVVMVARDERGRVKTAGPVPYMWSE